MKASIGQPSGWPFRHHAYAVGAKPRWPYHSPTYLGIAMKIVGLLFLLASLPAFAQTEVSGTCLVIDGDTVNVISHSGTIRVRLRGIAAPEINQRGGKEATTFLERYAEGKPVRCVLDEATTSKFEVGTCYVGGQDIAAAVVKAGLARDCPRISGGKYRAIESPQARKLFYPKYCGK
jgi:endonuclease YncB( thermonuclease family)